MAKKHWTTSLKEKTCGNEGNMKKYSHKTSSTQVAIVHTENVVLFVTNVTYENNVLVMIVTQTTIIPITHHTQTVGTGVAVQT